MFGILSNLTKAVVGVVVAPVALAIDIVSLPKDACDNNDAFSRTESVLNSVGQNVKDAIDPGQ